MEKADVKKRKYTEFKTEEAARAYYASYRERNRERIRAYNNMYNRRKKQEKLFGKPEPEEKEDRIKYCSDCRNCKISYYHKGMAYCSMTATEDYPVEYFNKKNTCSKFNDMG